MALGVNTRTSFQTAAKMMEKQFSNHANAVRTTYNEFFQIEETRKDRSFAQWMAYQELGLLQQKTEGNVPEFDQPRELIPEQWNYLTFALASIVTEEAQLEDALHFMGKLPAMLADSERETKEYLFWNILNQGWAADVLLSDGQPLFSSNHLLGPIPASGGIGVQSSIGLSYSNNLGAVEPSPETIRQAEILFNVLLSDRGLADFRQPIELIFHPNLTKTMQEVTGAPLAPYTNDNTPNTAHGQFLLRPVRYLSSPYAWFMSAKKAPIGGNGHQLAVGFKWQNRVKTWMDNATGNWNIKTSFRAAWGPVGWRGIVGAQGAP